jgi:nucleoside 2-deoxyribosyltransferase
MREQESVYIIGSLRNPEVPKVAAALRRVGFDAFDDWYTAGPKADDIWRDYEKARGRGYVEALDGHHAKHVFDFDRHHLNRCVGGVLVLPAGRSAWAEMGYLRGQGKWVLALVPESPERWDIMLRFATSVHTNLGDLVREAVGWLPETF